MEYILVVYQENDSPRYDGKEYLERLDKIYELRAEGAEGELSVGEIIYVKTKKRVWKAVV